MKKGLKQVSVVDCADVRRFERRPDEEGIETR